jgi:hypothetical protein
VKELTKELELLLARPMSEELTQQQKEITRQIELVLEQEEMHYLHRSRANWAMHGDRNTTFFHNFAKACQKINTILKLKNGNGE